MHPLESHLIATTRMAELRRQAHHAHTTRMARAPRHPRRRRRLRLAIAAVVVGSTTAAACQPACANSVEDWRQLNEQPSSGCAPVATTAAS